MDDLSGAIGATHAIVTGGRGLKDAGKSRKSSTPKRPERVRYDRGVIGVIDLTTGEITQALSYEPSTEEWDWRSQNVNFKYGTLARDGNLLVVTENEVLHVELPSFKVLATYSSPEFNDLHSVHEFDDSWALTCTGRDLVLFMRDGQVQSQRIDTKTATWVEDPNPAVIDWRELHTQPHDTHPNYLWEQDGDVWVTRGNRGDIVRVGSHDSVSISETVTHDGSFQAGSWWATSVDGYVYELDSQQRLLRAIHVAGALEPKDLRPGWCRSVHVGPSAIAVGFSALRPSRLRRNLEWLATGGQYRDKAPTQIAFFDRTDETYLGSIQTEAIEMQSVFSIIPANL